jgi:sortase A
MDTPTTQPILPLPPNADDADTAANLIRHKLESIYRHEPDVISEAIETTQVAAASRSKHQQYMSQLATSGKSFVEIQQEWHNYYSQLTNSEKHEVWREFYAAQHHPIVMPQKTPNPQAMAPTPRPVVQQFQSDLQPKAKTTISDIKRQITSKVRSRAKLSRKAHIKSLGFGLSVGAFTMLLLLFGFFNERFIAPFITPSRSVSSTPLILDPNNTTVGLEPKIIIPKINVEVPVVYDVETIEEAAVQKGLERGVVHYATTPNPGEQGNAVIFGHSSNNILNKGKYKFAFVLLNRLESGDTFYIEKDGIRYVYKVFEKKIVSPTEISVLDNRNDKTSTVSLITCDPPGTAINRLVVVAEQITPDPNKNLASTAVQTDHTPEQLAGNPESLWSRMWNAVF